MQAEHAFMEGELAGCRALVSEQQQQLSDLKEELAGRRSDVHHLTKHSKASQQQVI
jgi:hypothetical protein